MGAGRRCPAENSASEVVTMETLRTEGQDAVACVEDRPSEEFIRAVAELLETDAEDMLLEMGYVYTEAVVREMEVAGV